MGKTIEQQREEHRATNVFDNSKAITKYSNIPSIGKRRKINDKHKKKLKENYKLFKQNRPKKDKGYKMIYPDSNMTFGRYKGFRVSEVKIINPSYFDWLKENSDVKIHESLLSNYPAHSKRQ